MPTLTGYAASQAGEQHTSWAGTDDERSLGDYAWYRGNSKFDTHPVATKLPNALGLYDMCGNVWEWCDDWFDRYYEGSVTDPRGPTAGSFRVKRGGCWSSEAYCCRVAYRYIVSPHYRNCLIGFRLVLDPSIAQVFPLL